MVSFQALLVFQYKLSKVCDFVMETPVYVNKVKLSINLKYGLLAMVSYKMI